MAQHLSSSIASTVSLLPSINSRPFVSTSRGLVLRHGWRPMADAARTRTRTRYRLSTFVVRAADEGTDTDKDVDQSTVISSGSGINEVDPSSSSNLILRAAWYGAEALGNIVAVFNPKDYNNPDGISFSDSCTVDAVVQGPLSRDFVVQAVIDDYEKGYFVTGNVSTGVYEEDCEFADPAGSFKSLKRFKNNCSNFGSLLEKSDVKLVKSKQLYDKFVAYWRFSCILKFPWRPILSSTGFTEYYFDPTSGRICRHVENWDVPKMVLLGQVFKPNPAFVKGKKSV